MRRFLVGGAGCLSILSVALVTLTARTDATSLKNRGWWQARGTLTSPRQVQAAQSEVQAGQSALPGHLPSPPQSVRDFLEGQRLFERETFGGNGRTCLTCHSRETGTVSPNDARQRFRRDHDDPLFVHDGSDDDNGDGLGDGRHVTRMLNSATILMRIHLNDNVEVKGHPEIRVVTVRRGIPTTQNTPSFDPVLMLDGRQPSLQAQALGAITDHAQATRTVKQKELDLLAKFQQTAPRFSARSTWRCSPSRAIRRNCLEAARRPRNAGALFFEDVPPDFSVTPPNFKVGACAACHSGPLLNQTNQFLPLAVPPGTRFQSVLVSEFNDAGNPVIDFVFRNQEHDLDPATNQDGNPDGIIEVSSPDPGRALITGRADDFFPFPPGSFDHLNAFKISQLRGIRDTAPYFHDNSSKTLEDVVEHYRRFFLIVSDPDGPGPDGPLIVLDDQDKKDIVAFMKLL